MDHRFRGTTTRPWLDRGPHHRNRVSLGGGAPRALRRDCGRVCSSQRQRHRHDGTRSSPSKKGNIGDPDCSRVVRRPGGGWPSCESSATRWQHHWPVDAVARCCRQATRTLARGCPRLAIMVNVGFPDAVLAARAAQAAAQSLGLEIATLEIRRAGDIVPAFESLKDHADALYVTADALLNANRLRINTLALGARLPSMHEFRESVEAGGLMSYGPNLASMFRRAAELADKILRGTKPGDIPVEQPTKFDLVVNLI